LKAFVLAAGLGQRLRPLTESTPKPLLEVGGKPLIFWHMEKLQQAGIDELVINCHWLADQLQSRLGDGSDFGLSIRWSPEPELLQTGGGLKAALPLLGSAPFALISADIWSDIDYRWLMETEIDDLDARLVMVPSPAFHPQGDFTLDEQHMLQPLAAGASGVTYSGVGLISPKWVESWSADSPAFSWIGPLQLAVQQGRIGAVLHRGSWTDVGTAERLADLNRQLDEA
jgi:N-acetyl-alpha-D-muramate 1-phosphate uridylyltransferase